MIEPKIDDLLAAVDSKYTLVILAAKRAREINSYYSQLGEGRGEFVPPLDRVGSLSNKPLSIALEEIAEGKIGYERTEEPSTVELRLMAAQARSRDGGCCSASPAGSPRTRRRSSPGSSSTAGADVHGGHDAVRERFVGADTFAAFTGNPVHTSLWDSPGEVLHVRLAREADVAVVAPATANVIAKLAHGLADDLLTSTLLEATCPLVLAPAMHTGMWEHPATRGNVATLLARGVAIRGPGQRAAGGRRRGHGTSGRARGDLRRRRGTLDRRPDLAGER